MKRLLPILFLLISSAVSAESGSYRVEVIVFRNLAITADASQVEELRSFSQFPALEEADLPDDLLAMTEKSDYMDNVWRRLRSSKMYRPLLFTAWEQNRTDYYPPMRIHDKTIIDTQLNPPTSIVIADLTSEDPLAQYRSDFYSLDGSVQLRRSRFLHLYLDLEIRQQIPVAAGIPEQTTMTNSQAGFFNTPDMTEASGGKQPFHNVYRLKQNRQVRTGIVQYFDTPYFGALVFVTPVSAARE